MTSELRDAVEVWCDAYDVWGDPAIQDTGEADKIAADVIEADREAVRAEQAAELAKWQALAETLAGALGEIAQPDFSYTGILERGCWRERTAREALTKFKALAETLADIGKEQAA